jgi:hypothetical protein
MLQSHFAMLRDVEHCDSRMLRVGRPLLQVGAMLRLSDT